ncbi:MAG: outer membrane lipoprotein-sorting protein [Candidatus Cloacimonetes bacterium]|nr:outer membrane lipoprotein-sorting protein [Candidatus Cloacimonadota bacterium]
MRNLIITILMFIPLIIFAEYPSGEMLLKKIDENMYSENIISVSTMIIHSRRATKTMKLKSWKNGDNSSFSEYLSPPKNAGTKMLKLDNNLWIYNPQADRTIRISGHMLRQSVMGSDLSYEDMMEEDEISKIYQAEVIGEEVINEADCWILMLTAKVADVNYQTRKIWVDKTKYLALREERFGKSGKLLKTTTIDEVFLVGKRWYPKKIMFKDVLKKGKGTELIIESIEFDANIPASIFSKASLRK